MSTLTLDFRQLPGALPQRVIQNGARPARLEVNGKRKERTLSCGDTRGKEGREDRSGSMQVISHEEASISEPEDRG